MSNTRSEDLTIGSDSEPTSPDSDQVDEFDSEVEFSRVLPTPSSKKQGSRSHELQSSPKELSAKEQTLLEHRTPIKNVNNDQRPQNTQHLPLLSGTQLRAMMSDEANSDSGARADTILNKSSKNFDYLSLRNTIGDETDGRVDEDEPIDTDGIGPDVEEERILSSDDELNQNTNNTSLEASTDAPNVTPVEVSSGTFESQGRFFNRRGHLKDAGYIDETPLKLLSMPTPPSRYVCVIVKWDKDPNWWPARVEKTDWEKRKKRAEVLFRLDQFGFVDLSAAAGEFELMKGAKVHLIGHGKRNVEYTVVETQQSSAFPKVLATADGCDRVVLETRANAKTTKARSRSVARNIEVDVSNVYFTNKDIETWVAKRNSNVSSPLTPTRQRLSRALSLRQNGEEHNAGDNSKSRELVSTSTPRKRRRSAASPKSRSNGSLRDAIEEATTTPYTPRKQRSVLQTSPQVSPSKLSALRALRASPEKMQASPILFAKMLFSISIGSSNRNKQRLVTRLPDLILRHGGEVLEDGLSHKVKLSEMSEEDGWMPELEHDFGDATFCAVLADSPRRTLKYLEMLALGWPCLHYQYLLDCVHHDELLDWQPYLLPAGELNLASRKMTVSLSTQAFHRRWLQGVLLDEQFRKRRIVLKSAVPLCVLLSSPVLDDHRKWILVTLSGPLYRVWFYEDVKSIPQGSLVLWLDSPGDSYDSPDTDPELLFQIKSQAAADVTIHKGLEWLVQCLINGDLV